MSIDYTAHTKKCQDKANCPEGWLISFLDNEDVHMSEPYAKAPLCHLQDFISSKNEYLDGEYRYWQYKYPLYPYIHYQPKKLELNNDIRAFKSF